MPDPTDLAGRAQRDRLLMLAPIIPSDRGSGLAMRAGFFLDAYSRRFDVDLVVVPVAGSMEPTPFVQSRVQRLQVLKLGGVGSHYRLVASVRDPVARLEAFRQFGRPSLAALADSGGPSLEALAAGSEYRVVHVFRLYLAGLSAAWTARAHDRTRLVLDCDENDALAYRRIAAMERRRGNSFAADWAEAEATAFDAMASAWLPKFNVVLAASRQEAGSLARPATAVHAIPNLMASPPPYPAPRRPRRPRKILFVGTLGYAPNAGAIHWFVSRVWPRLDRALHHRVQLMIVGRNPPASIARLRRRGITVAGSVTDVRRYYRNADVAIAPLFAGGGTRFKILEAATFGVPLATTSFGIAGTTFQREIDVLVADDHEGLLRACLSLLRDTARSHRLVTNARMKARRDYSPSYWRARIADLAVDDSNEG
jgi:glycosyltransferase involved in cell wall biosynthesis